MRAIQLRTRWEHSQRRSWPKTPASRKEAAVTTTAEIQNAKGSSAAVLGSGAKLLGAIQKITLAQRGTAEVGGALVAVTSTGAGDDDEERTT